MENTSPYPLSSPPKTCEIGLFQSTRTHPSARVPLPEIFQLKPPVRGAAETGDRLPNMPNKPVPVRNLLTSPPERRTS